MKLNNLQPMLGSAPNGKRVGRGAGSGLGKTCGRGVKGQKSRSGVAINGFEGGQMSIYRRLPKRGFVSKISASKSEVSLRTLQASIDAGLVNVADQITINVLKNAGVIKSSVLSVKVIFAAGLSSKLNLCGLAITPSAKEAVTSLGGLVAE